MEWVVHELKWLAVATVGGFVLFWPIKWWLLWLEPNPADALFLACFMYGGAVAAGVFVKPRA